jgi:UDP-N-acetylmuramyl pentapeptide phosphotransferase/UDP-N-acetylglucosamine-1-phosphate transferase
MAVFGFGAYAIAAYVAAAPHLTAVCAALAAASAAFLTANLPPARIFMGDVGAIPLGFLAGALGLQGWRDGLWPLWFPLLVFAPFVCDATLTLLRRLWRRERVWQAHREHYYQRLVRMGFGHGGTVRVGYTVMAGCALTALAARAQPPAIQALALVAAFAVLAAIAVWVDVRWAKYARASGGIQA